MGGEREEGWIERGREGGREGEMDIWIDVGKEKQGREGRRKDGRRNEGKKRREEEEEGRMKKKEGWKEKRR